MKVLIHDEAFVGHLRDVLESAASKEESSSDNELQMGVVIGIPGVKQATVVHIAPCPPPEGEGPTATWVERHARLVARMLPGGVDVLGVAAIGPVALFEKEKTNVKQALVNVHKVLTSSPQIHDYAQRVMLHVEPTSMKMTSRLIDMSNSFGNGSPQDVKLVKNCTAFTELACDMVLQSLGHVGEEVVGQGLQKQMVAYTKQLEATLEASEVLIGGERCEDSALLSAKLPAAGDDNVQTVEFILKQPAPPRQDTLASEPIPLTGAGAQVLVQGAMGLRALLPPRATCGEAVAAIRQDARRSLQARCGMHCEDLELIEDEQRDLSLRHELPKRVFLSREKAPSTVPFCDYVFHGDDPADCLQAFDEILGLAIDVEDIEHENEASPTGEIREAEEAAQVEEMVEEMIQEGAKQLRKDPANAVIVVALGVCVALLAVLLGYVFLRD